MVPSSCMPRQSAALTVRSWPSSAAPGGPTARVVTASGGGAGHLEEETVGPEQRPLADPGRMQATGLLQRPEHAAAAGRLGAVHRHA
jgi:hypothetical protein